MSHLNWTTRLAATKQPAAINIVMLHGFGANANDLAPLADLMDPRQNWNWYMPEAPVPMGQSAFAWFPSNEADLSRALYGELWKNLADYDSPEIDQAVANLEQDMTAMAINGPRTVMAGFSQGSMMALAYALNHRVGGLILWSSALFARERLEKELPRARLPRFLQSHGSYDTVLRISDAQRLKELLQKHQNDNEWVEFTGGHEINGLVLEKSTEYLWSLSGGHQR